LTKKNADKLSSAFEQTLHMASSGYNPVEWKKKTLSDAKTVISTEMKKVKDDKTFGVFMQSFNQFLMSLYN